MTSHMIFYMAHWQVQDAKARFSEFLDTAIRKGPQIVTRRGVEAAVLIPIEEWNRLRSSARPSLKEILLGPGPRFELSLPDRGSYRHRLPMELK